MMFDWGMVMESYLSKREGGSPEVGTGKRKCGKGKSRKKGAESKEQNGKSRNEGAERMELQAFRLSCFKMVKTLLP